MSCPVDHTKAVSTSSTPFIAPSDNNSASQCPVDHASLAKNAPDATECPVDHTARSSWLSFLPSLGSSTVNDDATSSHTSSTESPNVHSKLSTSRETSSIPRGVAPSLATSASPASATSPSSSSTTPSPTDPGAVSATSEDAKWIYPSEAQFFAAMARKNHNPQALDMKTVVPIHNAVNERTWAEIIRWENGQADSCGGPRLISFKGRPGDISPRARMKTWMGYTAPFDRHDWVVDRCGTRVRYIIDFYAGKSAFAGMPSFYLDVRPALDGWEGAKMRMQMFLGLSSPPGMQTQQTQTKATS